MAPQPRSCSTDEPTRQWARPHLRIAGGQRALVDDAARSRRRRPSGGPGRAPVRLAMARRRVELRQASGRQSFVDERIVGRKPRTLSFAEAAALPLTSITAWEAFFDRLGVDHNGGNRGQSVLIIGGAGGVGSIAIQLAKIAGLVVVTTASRLQTREWRLQWTISSALTDV